MADATYQPKVYNKQGGDDLVIAAGGSLDIENGGALKLAGEQVTATAQQINALSGLINAEGDIQLADTVWEDLRFPAAGINPPGAVSDPTLDANDGRLVFSASATNMIAFQAQMPHAWKEGSAIEPHVHWSPTDGNAGNVVWQLEYKLAGVNASFPGSWTTISGTDAAEGADKHQIAGLPSIDMTGQKLSCMLLCRLSRLGGDAADTYPSTVKLNEIDIHYQIDTLGSDEEYIK